MVEPYRKAIGSNVWHFCSNCTTWPGDDHIASLSPEQIGNEELCTECIARHATGDCADYSDATIMEVVKKCPVIFDGKKCGRDLFPELAAGLYLCPSGHRILIVPPAGTKKSSSAC